MLAPYVPRAYPVGPSRTARTLSDRQAAKRRERVQRARAAFEAWAARVEREGLDEGLFSVRLTRGGYMGEPDVWPRPETAEQERRAA